jgi:hypothetical protein
VADTQKSALGHEGKALPPDLSAGYGSVSRPRPEQFYADAGDAEGGGAVVADQPAREADQDRREVVSHGRYVTFQMAEVAVLRQRFADVLSLIARCGHRASTSMTGRPGRMRQTTTAEMRLDQGKR